MIEPADPVFLPAGPQELWLGWLDRNMIRSDMAQEDAAAHVVAEPVIGWALLKGNVSGEWMPAPITPSGVIARGITRYYGTSREAAYQLARNSAVAWRDRLLELQDRM